MDFKPLQDYILISKPQTEDKTKGGLLLPDISVERSSVAEVLAVGPGRWVKGEREPMHVKVGDKLLLTKFLGQEFKIDQQEVILIKQENIISKLV